MQEQDESMVSPKHVIYWPGRLGKEDLSVQAGECDPLGRIVIRGWS